MRGFVKVLGGVRATIFACLFLLASIAFGYSHYTHKVYVAATQVAKAHADKIARAKEEGWRQGIHESVRKLIKQGEAREKVLETDIAALRARKPTLVVRDRFHCPTPPDSTGTGGEGDRGLLSDDAEFLLRVGARANKVRDERNTCIEILKKERGEHVAR